MFVDAADFRAGLEVNYLPSFDYYDPLARQPYAQYRNFFNLYAAWWPDAPGDHNWWHFSIIKDLRDEIFLPWANAETGWRRLSKKYKRLLSGRSHSVQKITIKKKGVYYRLRTGRFTTRQQANKLCGQLKAAGQTCIAARY